MRKLVPLNLSVSPTLFPRASSLSQAATTSPRLPYSASCRPNLFQALPSSSPSRPIEIQTVICTPRTRAPHHTPPHPRPFHPRHLHPRRQVLSVHTCSPRIRRKAAAIAMIRHETSAARSGLATPWASCAIRIGTRGGEGPTTDSAGRYACAVGDAE